MLFYVLAVLVITLQIDSALMLNLAWVYVALRLVHTIIHITYNSCDTSFHAFAAVVTGTVGDVDSLYDAGWITEYDHRYHGYLASGGKG